MSDTPRTAAIARKWSLKGGGTNTSDASPEAKELYEHAFELEREAAALREALEESIKLWNPHCFECGGFGCHTLEPIRCKTMDRQDAIRAALKGKP